MHLSFKSICNKDHKGVICNMTPSSNSSQSAHPVGGVLWEELPVLSRFHSLLQAHKWILLSPVKYFYPLSLLLSLIANSADPDEMLHCAAFHLGLHYLPKYLCKNYDPYQTGP